MNNDNNKKIINNNTIIGEYYHKKYLEFQAKSGYKITGGSEGNYRSDEIKKRLVSDINLLSSKERKILIMNEILFNN